jgi:hypothetical protein
MRRLLVILGLILLACGAQAAIVTQAATDISTYKVTISGNHGGAGIAYFKYGTSPNMYVYRTENQSVNGVFTTTINGWPLMGGMTYYYTAVDAEDGAVGDTFSFTLSSVTILPTSTFGNSFAGFSRAKLNITKGATNLTEPYANVFGGGRFGLAVFIGILYAIVMIGLLIFTEDVVIPSMLGVIIAGGVYTLLPPEFQQVAYAMTVVALAGIAYTIIRGWRK